MGVAEDRGFENGPETTAFHKGILPSFEKAVGQIKKYYLALGEKRAPERCFVSTVDLWNDPGKKSIDIGVVPEKAQQRLGELVEESGITLQRVPINGNTEISFHFKYDENLTQENMLRLARAVEKETLSIRQRE